MTPELKNRIELAVQACIASNSDGGEPLKDIDDCADYASSDETSAYEQSYLTELLDALYSGRIQILPKMERK